MSIEVTLLGTGSPLPDPNRAGPATLVRAGTTTLLVDAGRAVGLRLAAAGVLPTMLDAVLLTHLHSDHISALNDVITGHWVMQTGEPEPLQVHGPVGTQRVVDAILEMLAPDIGYRIAHHDDLHVGPRVEVTEREAGDRFEVADVRIGAEATEHKPVEPTLGYRIEHGSVTAAIAGDTVPCDGLDLLCAGADIYVQTAIRDDLVRLVPSERLQDILDYHSTVEQAARTASTAGVKTLVLTHYVPPLQPGQEDEWRALATPHFSGEIVLGDDLTSVTAG